MKENVRIVVLLSLLLVYCQPIYPSYDPVKLVGDFAWEPFYGRDLPEGGFIMALVKATFVESGLAVQIFYEPWSRALLSVYNYKYDAAIGAYFTEERSKKFLYSDPFYTNEIILLSLKAKNIKYAGNLKNLVKYRVGTLQDNAYSELFDSADYLNKEPVVHPKQNLEKLFLGRIDVMVASKLIAFHLLKQSYNKRISEVEVLKPSLSYRDLYIIVSRQNPRAKEIIKNFNHGLKAIKGNGKYEQTLQRLLVLP